MLPSLFRSILFKRGFLISLQHVRCYGEQGSLHVSLEPLDREDEGVFQLTLNRPEAKNAIGKPIHHLFSLLQHHLGTSVSTMLPNRAPATEGAGGSIGHGWEGDHHAMCHHQIWGAGCLLRRGRPEGMRPPPRCICLAMPGGLHAASPMHDVCMQERASMTQQETSEFVSSLRRAFQALEVRVGSGCCGSASLSTCPNMSMMRHGQSCMMN